MSAQCRGDGMMREAHLPGNRVDGLVLLKVPLPQIAGYVGIPEPPQGRAPAEIGPLPGVPPCRVGGGVKAAELAG
jgi:hypothetical protein